MSKLVYVSGPMTATLDYPCVKKNVARLEAKARELFGLGLYPICPVFSWFDNDPDLMRKIELDVYGNLYEQIIALDLELITRCDEMYMLCGWKTSRGASREHAHALVHQLPIMYEKGDVP